MASALVCQIFDEIYFTKNIGGICELRFYVLDQNFSYFETDVHYWYNTYFYQERKSIKIS